MTLAELVGKAINFDSWSQGEKIALFGWFLHTHENCSRFTTAQLRVCYEQVHLQPPSSFSPFFKVMENKKPKDLLQDGKGYYLPKHIMDGLAAQFGERSHTAPISGLLKALPSRLLDTAEQGFIEEALRCIGADAPRAAIVLGWCAVVDRFRRKVISVGFDKFNIASTSMKNQTTGKFKNWNKGLQAHSVNDLLPIFDTDLMLILEGMGLIDDNQAKRLLNLFHWRCNSAHPADAPIGAAHVVSFFSDAVDLVLASKAFDIPAEKHEPHIKPL